MTSDEVAQPQGMQEGQFLKAINLAKSSLNTLLILQHNK